MASPGNQATALCQLYRHTFVPSKWRDSTRVQLTNVSARSVLPAYKTIVSDIRLDYNRPES